MWPLLSRWGRSAYCSNANELFAIKQSTPHPAKGTSYVRPWAGVDIKQVGPGLFVPLEPVLVLLAVGHGGPFEGLGSVELFLGN